MNSWKFIWLLAALAGILPVGTGSCELRAQVSCELRAQVSWGRDDEEEAMNMTEQVLLFTDRSIYAVNESIWFRAFYRINEAPVEESLSRVLYVELVTPSGLAVTGAKYPLQAGGSAGTLELPPDLLTGVYYLRAYTRWMRNFGPRSYGYVPLTIINPYRQGVLNGGNGSREGHSMYGESRRARQAVICSAERPVYRPGEEVTLELGIREREGLLPGDYCVSVVPAGLADTLWKDAGFGDVPAHFSFDFLPEIRGVSISGTVVLDQDASISRLPQPSPSTRLHFSMPGEHFEYAGTMTDDMGRFIVTLPERTGTQELFVAAESRDQVGLSVLIDQDFATDSLPFPAVPFDLSPARREAATRMVISMQLSTAFRSDSADQGGADQNETTVPFYGVPGIIVDLEEFVSLPTMTEVIENLVPRVYVKYTRGVPSLKIESQNGMVSQYPPLILMDRIPVFDQQAVLDVDPSRIRRIEVIDEVFVRGSMMYGGIMVFTSREGDMASIELPENSYFFDYRTYHPPGRHDPDPGTGRIPDSRNTLMWIDSVRLDPQEKKNLKFFASSREGEYIILVRGVSPRNEIIYGTGSFRVARDR